MILIFLSILIKLLLLLQQLLLLQVLGSLPLFKVMVALVLSPMVVFTILFARAKAAHESGARAFALCLLLHLYLQLLRLLWARLWSG